MAQANYLTSAIGTLVTGATAKQFTSPVLAVQVQIPAVLVGHHHSHGFPLDHDAVELGNRVGRSRRLFAAQLNAIMIADHFRRVS
jgi:hypothetical protein